MLKTQTTTTTTTTTATSRSDRKKNEIKMTGSKIEQKNLRLRKTQSEKSDMDSELEGQLMLEK